MFPKKTSYREGAGNPPPVPDECVFGGLKRQRQEEAARLAAQQLLQQREQEARAKAEAERQQREEAQAAEQQGDGQAPAQAQPGDEDAEAPDEQERPAEAPHQQQQQQEHEYKKGDLFFYKQEPNIFKVVKVNHDDPNHGVYYTVSPLNNPDREPQTNAKNMSPLAEEEVGKLLQGSAGRTTAGARFSVS